MTRHPTRDEVAGILREFKPDILQTDIDDLDGLDLPRTLSVLPVMRPGPRRACALPRPVAFEGPVSGSGQTTDWDRPPSWRGAAKLILAGGLNAVNVAEAMRQVQPFGVDVSSGVEASPASRACRR